MGKIKIRSKKVLNKNRIRYYFDEVINIDYLEFYTITTSEEWRVEVGCWDCLNRKLIVFIESVLRGLNSK